MIHAPLFATTRCGTPIVKARLGHDQAGYYGCGCGLDHSLPVSVCGSVMVGRTGGILRFCIHLSGNGQVQVYLDYSHSFPGTQ